MARVIVYSPKGVAEEMESIDARESIARLGYTSAPRKGTKAPVGAASAGLGARDPLEGVERNDVVDEATGSLKDTRTSPATGAYNPTSNPLHPLHPVGDELPPGALLGQPAREKSMHPNSEFVNATSLNKDALKAELDKRGVDYDADAKVDDLRVLVDDHQYGALTVSQARELALQRGLKVPADARKDDIQKLLREGKL